MEDEHLPDGIRSISGLSILVVTFTVNSPQGPHQPPVQWYLHWNIEPTQMRKWPQFLAKASALARCIYLCITSSSTGTCFKGRGNAVALALSHGSETTNAPFVKMLMVVVVILYHAIFHFLIIAQFYTEIRLAKTGRKAICAWRMTARNICNFILGL